jgi:hypothetical protein
MSRIKIEDLPAAENLTAEQEALVEGAGLRPFRPTLEGLEDRQMMDAGLASALPVSPPPLGPAQLSLRQLPTARAEAGAVQMPTAAPDQVHSFAKDAGFVANKAAEMVEREIIKGGRFDNFFKFREITRNDSRVDGSQIVVDLHVSQGWVIKDDVKIELRFEKGALMGDSQVYRLVGRSFNFFREGSIEAGRLQAELDKTFSQGVKVDGQFDLNNLLGQVKTTVQEGWNRSWGGCAVEQQRWEAIEGGVRVSYWIDDGTGRNMGWDLTVNVTVSRYDEGRGQDRSTFLFRVRSVERNIEGKHEHPDGTECVLPHIAHVLQASYRIAQA